MAMLYKGHGVLQHLCIGELTLLLLIMHTKHMEWLPYIPIKPQLNMTLEHSNKHQWQQAPWQGHAGSLPHHQPHIGPSRKAHWYCTT